MAPSEIATKLRIGNAIPVITAPLLPGAMISQPVSGSVLLPGTLLRMLLLRRGVRSAVYPLIVRSLTALLRLTSWLQRCVLLGLHLIRARLLRILGFRPSLSSQRRRNPLLIGLVSNSMSGIRGLPARLRGPLCTLLARMLLLLAVPVLFRF